MNSEIIDSIFIKIKNENLNKIHDWVFKYMLINTTCSEEVIFIKRKLQYSKIRFSKQMLLDFIDFSEDFQENYNILLELHTKYKRQVPSFKYTYVLETAETHDEIEAILNLMKAHEIGFSVITLIALLEKQKTYNEARKILNEKILIDDSNKKRLYGKSYDRILK